MIVYQQNYKLEFLISLILYKNVDLVNVAISQSKVIKELMDQYDTHPSAAIAALDLAKIKSPRIKSILISVLTKQSLAGKNKLTQKGSKITDNIDQLLIDINK
jgi:FMN-dependent NADH-azoreductase